MRKIYPNVFSRYTQPTWEFILQLLEEANEKELFLDNQLQEITEQIYLDIEKEIKKLVKNGKLDLSKKVNLLEHEDIYRILKEIENKQWNYMLNYFWIGAQVIQDTMIQTYLSTNTFTIQLFAPMIQTIQMTTFGQTKLHLPIGTVNKTTADSRIKIPWCKDGKIYSERLYNHVVDFQNKLNFILEEGVHNGKGVEWMQKNWRKLTQATAYDTARLLKTETAAMWSLATKDTYLSMGIEYVEIIGDAACGGICTEYVGEVIPLSDAELGDELPPYHPNCACEYIAYYEEAE